MRRKGTWGAAAILGLALVSGWSAGPDAAQTQGSAAVAIDSDDIGGVVTGRSGPEAGVWVIAETDDLPTLYRKIVVTDDQGRYVLPDLPAAEYSIWVRGYGLVDSPKVQARRGRQLALTAVPAPNAAAAAEYYPANYWLAMVRLPGEDTFPQGNIASQAQLASQVKSLARFQIGNKATRRLPEGLKALGLGTTQDALKYWASAGYFTEFNPSAVALPYYADWIDRIAAGELPEAPPRPTGAERNVVVTLWDASNKTGFLHDVVSTDKWNPTANSNGKVYGADWHHDFMTWLDPREHAEGTIPVPTFPTRKAGPPRQITAPSLTWGYEVIFPTLVTPVAPMFDHHGRVWISGDLRNPENHPAYCTDGTKNRFAKQYPVPPTVAGVAVYEPQNGNFTPVDLCFGTHHVVSDKGDRMYFNAGGILGWIDTEVWAKTRSSEQAQGWCAPFSDTNGDGRIVPGVDPPIEPRGMYSVNVSPTDGSVWAASPGTPGRFFRYAVGPNPPETCIAEVYEVPFNVKPSSPNAGVSGFLPRGIDVDSEGVAWSGLAGSGHIVSFDRRLCKGPLTGQAALKGTHCPEGWKLYPTPGPRLGNTPFSADFHYYSWVDRYNTFGLGADTPFVNGTNSDSLIALDKQSGKQVVLRVPYPLGFYTRGMDGRIDNPNTGWKGRGVWSSNSTRAVWHLETGVGSRAHMAYFQLRPTPLAK